MNKRFDPRLRDIALRSDFLSLVRKIAETITGSQRFLENWHLEAVAWHLEQVFHGKIRRLIICLPPRSLKSIMASVALPAWALGHDPTRKIICVTHTGELAAKHANDFRTIIGLSAYKRAFPRAIVSPFKNTEIETQFVAGGFRLGTSVTGPITGRGGDLIILDDPIKSQDVFSEAKRDSNNQLFQNTIVSRLDDKKTGAIIVVMQRLHANDLVGALLASSDEWTELNLPAIAEVCEKIQIRDTEFYHRTAGEPLHGEREPLEVLEGIRQEIGPSVFAAQYQQAPIPPSGLLIDREWIRYHSGEFPARTYGHIIIQSWDTAGKDGPRNSFSVCTTWLLLKGNYYLLDLVRGRFNYPQLRDTAIQCAQQFKPNAILIEDASTGIVLAEELRKSVPFVVKSIPVEMDKINRLFVQQGKFASGRVHFPKDAPYLAPLLTELLSFPQSRTSDQVDSISQALAYKHSGYTLDNVR